MARLLIVDDEDVFRALTRRVLERRGHEVLEAGDIEEARRTLDDDVELVLCDINMPGGSGLDLVRWLHSERSELAVVMLTGADDPEIAREALNRGAYGYLIKPITPNEIIINVASALRRRELELAYRDQVRELEVKVLTRTAALRDLLKELEETEHTARQAEQDAVDRLVTALTLRSEETGAHIRRMGRYAACLATRLGLDMWTEDEMRLAAMLHDVGKIGIPDAVLLKPESLTEEEFGVIKRHSALGHALLSEGHSRVVVLGARIALTHHERWDGSGYPQQLLGDQIPVEGRIAALADVFDAMTSERVYRRAMGFDEAFEVIRGESGRHFDPELVDLFLQSPEELVNIRAANPDKVSNGGPGREGAFI